MKLITVNCNKCLNCPYIFMIDELEDNLCIRCFIKRMNDRKKKETNDWIESVLI
jgi:hypothetical protein